MTNKKKVINALKNGAITRKDIFDKTGISMGIIAQMLHILRMGDYNLYGYKSYSCGRPVCDTVKNIKYYRQWFIDKCGFTPKNSWIVKKTDCTKQYVHQMLAGVDKKDTTSIRRQIPKIEIHKDFDKMIKDISKEYEVNYWTAFKIYSYKWAREKKVEK